jgi:HAD superfamily hydrolase (TIGR01509 family)
VGREMSGGGCVGRFSRRAYAAPLAGDRYVGKMAGMKTIIFDFGNVVGFFDHCKTLRRLERFTDMPGEIMYREIYLGPLEDEFESGRIGAEEFLDIFRDRCRLTCDNQTLAAAIEDIFEPNPEICDLIPKLKGRYRILLGSNTNPIHSRHFRQQFQDILSHFRGLVLSHDIGARKPRASFFEHCVALAECPTQECLFVDDLADNIAGARAAGLQGVVYSPGQDFVGQLRELNLSIDSPE